MIKTNNLQLLTYELIHVAALLRDKSELAAILQVTVPDSWPHFPEAFSLLDDESRQSNPPPTDWHGYFFIHPKDRVLVGSGGFKGQPDDAGTIEIGYEIAAEYWNRGFATEAAQGMIDYAFAHEQVQAVIAHTLAQINASNSVLQKVGMRFMTEVDDPEEGKLWRWQISRDEYHLYLIHTKENIPLASEHNRGFVQHQVEQMATTPIYMLNVLWFKPDGGAEKYHEYSQAVMPIIQKHGGLLATPLFQPQQTLIGEFDADLVFVMQFPSMEHFQQLLADPDLPQVAHLREEAITNSLLVQCGGGDWLT